MGEGWDDAERAALVALLRVQPDGLSWPEIAGRVGSTGSAIAVWQQTVDTGLFPSDDATEAMESAVRDVAAWGRADFRLLTFADDDYPARLRDVRQVPPIIFVRGEARPDDRGVSVVGSRVATAAGLVFAQEVARGLSARGLTTISGLARGIDTAAHRAALETGGRTVAVIGTGIRQYYPAENRELQDQIARAGLVMSQFWPDVAPSKRTFPMRNAVMSAYGYATVIVEASERSGARIQAREAVQHGRPVILSSSVLASTSWGTTMRDQPGVYVARDAREALRFVDDLLAQESLVDQLLSLAGG